MAGSKGEDVGYRRTFAVRPEYGLREVRFSKAAREMAEPLRLLERMRRSKTGWRLRDVHRLYLGFGFTWEEGARHRLYRHPAHPDLYTTVTRSSGAIPVGYVAEAVRLIDALLSRGKSDD